MMMTPWTISYLNEVVRAEMLALSHDMRAAFVRIAELIQARGLERVGMPYVRHVQGKLWEMRGRGKDGIARALYVVVVDRRILIVRAFAKKTQKTSQAEIALALKRIREHL